MAKFFSRAFKDVATVRTYKSNAERDTVLIFGRIDASFAYVSQQLNALSRLGGDALKLAGPVFLNGPLGPDVGVALREGDPELKVKFDAAIKCSGLHSSAAGLAIIANFGSRSVRLSGLPGSRSMILGSRSVRRT